MPLSRIAQEFADEIRKHDWSDAHTRLDRAGHDRTVDHTTAPALSANETDNIRTNVMWVAAQVLRFEDPNFPVHEFAVACGVPHRITHNSDGRASGAIGAGIRILDGVVAVPGTWDFPG